MQALINIVATIGLIVSLGFSTNGYAEKNSNHGIIKHGIISKVDVANNSFTVVEKKTGNIKTYKFPKKINVLVDRHNETSRSC